MTKETERAPGAETATEPPTDVVDRPSNLLVGPDAETLPSAPSDGRTAFVVVSLVSKTDRRVEQLERAAGGPADSVHVVCVKGQEGDGYDAVRTVNNPGDLTGLSMRIGEALSEVHGDDVYVYFDDITSLLQYADLSTAYRFLNVLTGRVRSADAVGFYGITPGAHDERTVNTLRNLFDDTVGEFS
jgi:hypothetical protein